MKNQKGFAPILIILLVLLVGAVGYFVYVKKSEPRVEQAAPASPANTISQLTKGEVLNGYDYCGIQFKHGEISIGFDEYQQLEQTCGVAVSAAYLLADAIIFADLDADGVQEALAPARIVRASSGGVLYVFKSMSGAAHVIASVSFGKENGKVISVDKGTVIVETDGAMGYTPRTITYRFLNNKLVEQ